MLFGQVFFRRCRNIFQAVIAQPTWPVRLW